MSSSFSHDGTLNEVPEMYTILSGLQKYEPGTTLKKLRILSQLLSSSEMGNYFYSLGGIEKILPFVINKEKKVAENAICILGSCASNNEGGQTKLSTKIVFDMLAKILEDIDKSTYIHARCVMYLLTSIVSNNTTGQTLARDTKCLHHMVVMFLRMIQIITLDSKVLKNDTITLTWKTLCIGLKKCVNDPQNEQNQEQVNTIIPKAIQFLEVWFKNGKDISWQWLTDCVESLLLLLIQVISCNLVNQTNFAAYSGICVLMRGLTLLDDTESDITHIQVKLVMLLDSAICGNHKNCISVASMGTIPILLELLEKLQHQQKLSILVTLTHLMEQSDENKEEFVKMNGFTSVVLATVNMESYPEVTQAANCLIKFCAKNLTENTTGTIINTGMENSPEGNKLNGIDTNLEEPKENAESKTLRSRNSNDRKKYLNLTPKKYPSMDNGHKHNGPRNQTIMTELNKNYVNANCTSDTVEENKSNSTRSVAGKSKGDESEDDIVFAKPIQPVRFRSKDRSHNRESVKPKCVERKVDRSSSTSSSVCDYESSRSTHVSRKRVSESIRHDNCHSSISSKITYDNVPSSKSSSRHVPHETRGNIPLQSISKSETCGSVHSSILKLSSNSVASDILYNKSNGNMYRKGSRYSSSSPRRSLDQSSRNYSASEVSYKRSCTNIREECSSVTSCCSRSSCHTSTSHIPYKKGDSYSYRNQDGNSLGGSDRRSRSIIRSDSEGTTRIRSASSIQSFKHSRSGYTGSVASWILPLQTRSQNNTAENLRNETEFIEFSTQEMANLKAGVAVYGWDFTEIYKNFNFHSSRSPKCLYNQWRSSYVKF